jgi:hypothetical protein
MGREHLTYKLDLVMPKLKSHFRDPIPVRKIRPLRNLEKIPLDTPSEFLPVYYNSKIEHRRAVYKMARYMATEFQYNLMYGYDGKGDESSSRAFLWLEDKRKYDHHQCTPVIGGCCFRLRRYKGKRAHWALQWVWLHPFKRRQGHLSKVWPYFKERFGDFEVEEPLSDEMSKFMNKRPKINE